ncbi:MULTISPECIES: substrate-binding periplasmic protein [unclassified Moraxella]|uniref:substrate-binding periplasmic protein n=1 Tax=unclassified Moraxella TaxID=2685852 RepID=UPI003AF844C5
MMKLSFFGTILCLGMVIIGCDRQNQTNTLNQSEVTATTPVASKSDTTVAPLQTYTMAVDATYPPFAFKDEKGQATGFNIDILKAIGKKQGFDVNVIPRDWNGIFDGLNSDSYDIVGSGVGINKERKQKFTMSDSFVISSMVIVVLTQTPIETLADIKGQKIGIIKGSTWKAELEKHTTNTQDVIEYESTYLAIKGLLSGEVIGVLDDKLVLNYHLQQIIKQTTKTFKEIEFPVNNTPTETGNDGIGYAMKKGNSELSGKINKGLADIKADGTYDKIYSHWFGNSPKK